MPERIDVRVICATHRDLGRYQREGKFREDLYARLNEYKLVLPPLYERKEDIFALVRSFLVRQGKPQLMPTFPFMTALSITMAVQRAVARGVHQTLGRATGDGPLSSRTPAVGVSDP